MDMDMDIKVQWLLKLQMVHAFLDRKKDPKTKN